MSHLATNSNVIKSLAIKIINQNSKNVVISAQYRQPATVFKQHERHLGNLLNKMKDSDKTIYIVG